jgi:16S rRNA (uracil1498-N3)-methyltransferase
MPVFFITSQQIHNGVITITDPLLTHLRASLRVRSGEEIRVGDERRRRYLMRVVEVDGARLRGQIIEEQTAPPRPQHAISIGQAILKGEKMDWVIQKATELGMAQLTPLISSHAIVRPKPDRSVAQQERWQRIALEAAQQSECWECPQILAPCEARSYFQQGPPQSVNLILSERGPGWSLASCPLPAGGSSLIRMAIGPEGGWGEEEFAQAVESGFSPVTLGQRILRAETATLVALSLLQSRLGELG